MTVDGRPAEVLDDAGAFFTRVAVRPGENRYSVVATDEYGQSITVVRTVLSESRPGGSVDFSRFTDLTASFRPEYARTSFRAADQTLHADIAVRNVGQYPAGVPLYVGVKNLSDPAVTVLNAAGTLPDGTPFYDFTGLVSGGAAQLLPDAATGTLSLSFANPNRSRFTYDLVFLGVPNRAPAFATVPELEAAPGRAYTYDAGAADSDGDPLTFALTGGPTGMTVDAATGLVTWTPDAEQTGNFPVAVRASDGRGGVAEQAFTVVSAADRPNRPPLFTTLPVGEAHLGAPYVYDAGALDPDRDTLTYSLAAGAPAGMTIDAATGVISWAPTAAQLGDRPVTVLAEDGRGGTASQAFTVCVDSAGNRPPLIVSDPALLAPLSVFAGSNLLANSDFEAVPSPPVPGAQGVLPDDWVTVATAFPGADTWSSDGSFGVSNSPDLLVSFPGGAGAHSGVHWVGGAYFGDGNFVAPRGVYEGLGQRLTTPLTPGTRYQLSASLIQATSPLYDAPGGYQVWLASDPTIAENAIRVGEFSPTTGADTWEQRLLSLTAPANAGFAFNYLVLIPYATDPAMSVYPGLDDISLTTGGLVAGVQYRYDVEALDPDGGPLAYSLTQAPPGMTIHAASGVISWTPGTGANLVTNLDFSTGNAGFRTELTYSPGNGFNPSVYTIGTSPAQWHNCAADFGDHTTGAGPMMIVNGSTEPDQLVWEQDVSVDPETRHEFDFWARSWYPAAPGRLQMWVEGRSIGTELSLPSDTAEWVRYRAVWNSGDATTATVSIRNATAASGGNDFAIYDIAFATTGADLAGMSFPVAVRVDDGRGGSDERRFEVTMTDEPPLPPPVVPTPAANQAAIANVPFRLALPAVAGQGFALISGPEGLMVHPTLGVVAWMPSREQVGTHQVVLKATDAAGNVTIVPFAVTVSAPNSAPVFTSTAPAGPASVGAPFEYRAAAQDAEPSALAFSLLDPLPGMAIDAVTGVFTWTPTAAQVGDRTATIRVSDGAATAEQTFALDVVTAGANRNPTIAVNSDASAWLGRRYGAQVSGADADGDPVRFELVSGPAGMTLDAVTGIIGWDPDAVTAATVAVRVRATDGRGGSAEATFGVSLYASDRNRAPQVVSNPARLAVHGGGYRYDLAARDPVRGTLRWTPAEDQTGPHTITVRALDSLLASGDQTFEVDVACANAAPTIASRPPTLAYAGAPFLYAVRATDPEGDALAFALESGPEGMAFQPGGSLLRWTPSAGQARARTVVVLVTDAAGNVDRQAFTVVVSTESPNRPPAVTSRPLLGATLGRTYSYTVAARDPDGDPLAFALGDHPDGMTISEAGVVSWTPTAAGGRTVTVEVTDGRGGVAVQTYTLTARPNTAPTISSAAGAIPDAALGSTFRYQIRATDAENDPLAFALDRAPAGMTIDGQGRIAWAVTGAERTETVRMRVADSDGLSSTVEFAIRVVTDTVAPSVRIVVSPAQVNLGGTVQVTVRASDDIGVASVGLTADGVAIALDSSNRAFFSAAQAGRVTFAATAADGAGNGASATADLRVVDPTVASDVRATFTRFEMLTAPGQTRSIIPDDNAVPPDLSYLTDVYGTVASVGQPIAEWKLLVARGDGIDIGNPDPDSPAWREIGRGTAAVADGKLGTFDPTLLPNDRYVLAVVANDVTGAGYLKPAEVNVVGGAKLGEFRLEFTDLSIPLSGIPVQITRVYDSRESGASSDFGYGWTMGQRDARIRETVPAGQSLVPDKSKVYLTAPDGTRVGFTYKEKLVQGLPFGWGAVFAPSFVADAGQAYKLEAPDDTQSLRGGLVGALGGEGVNPSHYRLTTPDGLAYDYDQTAGLRKITDPNGNTVTFTPNAITHSGGRVIALDRDGQGRITAIHLPDGGVAVRYRYDAKGDLVEVKQVTETGPVEKSLTSTISYRADRPHYLDEYIDANGHRAVKAEYDAAGRLKGVTDALGNRTEQSFDLANFSETVKDARGNPTIITYDARGNVTKSVQPTESGDIVTQYSYEDAADPDNETKVIDGRGFATTRSFDAAGNLTSETTADGTTAYTYSSQNKLTQVTDTLGRITAYAYDSTGNLTRVVIPLGDDSVFTYDAAGHVTAFVDFAGNVTLFSDYSSCGKPLTTTNPDGSIRKIKTNGYSQVIESTDERGNVTKYDCDLQGRLLSATDGEGHTTTTEYEGTNRTKVTDSLGNATRYEYDAAGRQTKILDAEGGEVSFGFDANGNLETVTDPVGNLTRFVYDRANRVKEEIDPLLKSRTYGYDAAGNRSVAIDRNGRKSTFAYDGLNRRTAETWYAGDGSVIRAITSAYDAAGNLIGTADPDAVLTYTYDALNRVRTATTVYSGTGLAAITLAYGYDANGNRNSVTDSAGVRVDSVYDERNRLESRAWQGGGIAPAKVAFDHYANGQRRSATRFADAAGTSKVGSTGYDYRKNGLSKSIAHTDGSGGALADYAYLYDAAGRLTQETHHGDTHAYGYDKTGQLTSVTIDGALAESFAYDENGNRKTSSGPNGAQIYQPAGPGNRLLEDGLFRYTYDGEGNLRTKTEIASGEVTEYTWDHRNRLVKVEGRSAGGIILSLSEYAYDAQDRRIAQTTAGAVLRTVCDGEHAWADYTDAGAVAARYLFGNRTDEILARWKPTGGTAWYLTDKLGTVRDVAGVSGTVINSLPYTAFGQIVAQSDPAAGDRFAFTGREFDAPIGDYFYRARYYDPTAGRFTGVDPIRFDAGHTLLYKFVSNQPNRFTDPSGKVDAIQFSIDLAITAFTTYTGLKTLGASIGVAVYCAVPPYYFFEPVYARDLPGQYVGTQRRQQELNIILTEARLGSAVSLGVVGIPILAETITAANLLYMFYELLESQL